MGKSHRDNHAARKKRGDEAFSKKAKRRSKREKHVGAWEVDFSCGKTEKIPFAGSKDIEAVAKSVHHCGQADCKPIQYHPMN